MARVFAGEAHRLYIDLKAISNNLRELRRITPGGIRIAGAVKADAYGHGLVPVSKQLAKVGIDILAIQEVAEGALLRKAGIGIPLMVLVDHGPEKAEKAVSLGLSPVVFRIETVRALSAAAQKLGREVECSLKVDTGMGRLGIQPAEVIDFLSACADLPGVKITGLASHFANSGVPDDGYTKAQTDRYLDLLAEVDRKGFNCPQSSLFNSGGTLIPPAKMPPQVSIVRTGIALYGGLPSSESAGVCNLGEAMSFKSRLVSVRKVKAGSKISYGMTYQAPEDAWLGVVPVGYSDGYPRSLSNKSFMLVSGKRVPVRGRVCMNLTVIDLGGLEQLPKEGDEVVLLGRQGDECISAEELAGWAGTISYEIFTSLGNSNRRRYINR